MTKIEKRVGVWFWLLLAVAAAAAVVLAGSAGAFGGWHAGQGTALGAALVLGLALAGIAVTASRLLGTAQGLEEARAAAASEARRAAALAERSANEIEVKARFLDIASHDLRQPLQAAGMFVEVLAMGTKDERTAGIVDKIRQSIDAAGGFVSSLLDISRLEGHRVVPRTTSFPIMPMLANLADQMEHELASGQIRLRIVPTSLWVQSDPVLVERVLKHLLLNAFRYTGKGSVLMGCRRQGDKVVIHVLDSGVGIPADQIETIFDDFTKLDADPHPGRPRGPGLGLAIVRRLSVLLHHPVTVRSIPNQGSNFAVTLPRTTPVRSEGSD